MKKYILSLIVFFWIVLPLAAWAASSTVPIDESGNYVMNGLKVNGNIEFSGDLLSTSVTSVGLSIQLGANQACNTTCDNGCMTGFNTGVLGIALGHMVSCSDASADECLCAGN